MTTGAFSPTGVPLAAKIVVSTFTEASALATASVPVSFSLVSTLGFVEVVATLTTSPG